MLAGGSSTRMHRDKAFLTREGSTLLERAEAALRAGGATPIVVVGGDRARIEGLGLAHVPDRDPGGGPLGGIITALEHLTTDLVMVLACDHLDPSGVAVRAVVDALGSADVAVPVSDGEPQWLHSVWRRQVLPILLAAYERGLRAPRQLADELNMSWAAGGDPSWYRDADRPEDLANGPH